MKVIERENARILRREQGKSIKEIAASLRVSTSSVSHWVRDIELMGEQIDTLRERNPALNGQLIGVKVRAVRARAVRQGAQAEGRAAARSGDSLHAAGCMLFWAEGARRRNTVHLTNSDPALIAFFMRFLRTFFAVPSETLRVWCNLPADHGEQQREVEDFWLRLLDLPRDCLTSSTVNVRSRASLGKRTNTLPYGTCRLTVHNTVIVQHLYGAIQEYAGFDRPAWLDL